jgi:hypothetical protein
MIYCAMQVPIQPNNSGCVGICLEHVEETSHCFGSKFYVPPSGLAASYPCE